MKKILGFLLLFSSLTLTGCLDILEELTVKKDGSGSFTYQVDAVKMMEQMASFAAMDTTGEMIPKMKHSLDSTFMSQWEKYKDIKGISNIKVDTSTEYIYKVSFDFTNFDALNAARNLDQKPENQNAFSFEKGKVTRRNNVGELPANLGGEDGNEESSAMAKQMLAEMKYKIVFKLPNKVKEVNNKTATISDDKTTVTLETNLGDVIEKKVEIGMEVSYKK
jgi:hypothetical protein